MFCLDTNAVIAAIGKRPGTVDNRLQNEFGRGTSIIVPVIVLHELLFGVAKSTRRTENKRMLDQFLAAPFDVPDFDAEDADDAAEIRAYLQSKGTPIGPYDVLIAAQARRRGATLVTANVREFRRVPRLSVEDWAKPWTKPGPSR
jgi:tRNA(fMet)-specific endonuclease VapC